jgi:hypothetical protein
MPASCSRHAAQRILSMWGLITVADPGIFQSEGSSTIICVFQGEVPLSKCVI